MQGDKIKILSHLCFPYFSLKKSNRGREKFPSRSSAKEKITRCNVIRTGSRNIYRRYICSSSYQMPKCVGPLFCLKRIWASLEPENKRIFSRFHIQIGKKFAQKDFLGICDRWLYNSIWIQRKIVHNIRLVVTFDLLVLKRSHVPILYCGQ